MSKVNKALVAFGLSLLLVSGGVVKASSISNFNQVINPGTLSVDIVDGTYTPVVSPSVTFPATTFSFACQTNSATFGTVSQQIYVKNPDAADNGWTVSLAANSTTDLWDGASSDYDFNDTNISGCSDGVDSDSFAGQMTVNLSSVAVTPMLGCTATGISSGSNATFTEGSIDSITLANAGNTASTNCYWDFTNILIDQKIPAEQSAGSYSINMSLSVIAN